MNTTYGIYLPNDTEMWFKIKFSSESRAHWFAEANGLDPAEYEIRSTLQAPTIEPQVQEAA